MNDGHDNFLVLRLNVPGTTGTSSILYAPACMFYTLDFLPLVTAVATLQGRGYQQSEPVSLTCSTGNAENYVCQQYETNVSPLGVLKIYVLMDLRNKVALVTGGASGYGKEYCKELFRQGCKVS